MKNLTLLFLAITTCMVGAAQSDASQAPYKRFKSVPPFKLLLTDSSTVFGKEDLPKKKTVLFMMFSPDCDHCKHEMEQIISNIAAFEQTQLVLSTTREFDKMMEFYRHFELDRFDNITVGKDVNYMFPVYFDIRNLPFLAFYNKKKELISVYQGAMPIDKVIEELKK